MKTMIKICFAVFIVLFLLSAMNMMVAIVVPSLRGSAGLAQQLMYNAESIVVAPARFLPGLPVFVLLVGSIVAAALMLRWAFGGSRHERRREHSDVQQTVAGGGDLDELARDLQRSARRMEERLEALETILLDRTQSRH